jgi:hypothetical protein
LFIQLPAAINYLSLFNGIGSSVTPDPGKYLLQHRILTGPSACEGAEVIAEERLSALFCVQSNGRLSVSVLVAIRGFAGFKKQKARL